MTIAIELTQGYVTYVDPIDADLADYRWKVDATRKVKYAKRTFRSGEGSRNGGEQLHRVILSRMLNRPLVRNEQVDHIDGDGLNNCRGNLRLANHAQNGWNTEKRQGVYKGVRFHKLANRWDARICVNRKKMYLGLFDTPEDAAIAYNHAAQKHFGEFARFNDIPNWENTQPIKVDKRVESKGASGYKGVYKQGSRWCSHIIIGKKLIYLGSFDTPEAAHEAYCKAKNELNDIDTSEFQRGLAKVKSNLASLGKAFGEAFDGLR
jgi:hypothetical protein